MQTDDVWHDSKKCNLKYTMMECHVTRLDTTKEENVSLETHMRFNNLGKL